MSLTAAQVRGKIKSLAIKTGTDPRTLMRMYMMERFLERVSVSEYLTNFVIKGGILVSSLVGVSMRSTLDIDTSIRNSTLTLENAVSIMETIAQIALDDNVCFIVKNAENIMDEMEYPGIRISMDAMMENMNTPIKVDISTGDAITPRAIEYQYPLLLENRKIKLWSYNIETILAEKMQTILVRERANTRMRDYYDLYMIIVTHNDEIDVNLLKKAYIATSEKRESSFLFGREKEIVSNIENDQGLKELWSQYQKKFSYASSLSYQQVIEKMYDVLLYIT